MTKNFQILIVEDELMIAEMAREMLLDLNYSVVGIAKNYNEAINYLQQQNGIDLAILDINLNDKESGISLGEIIKKQYRFPFIYLTSYSDPSTIKSAIATEPSAYLIKPFSAGDLHATIEIIRAKRAPRNNTITVRHNDLNFVIEVNDILFVKSNNNYIEIYTSTKKYVERSSLERFLEDIKDTNFIRIHRSYVVNLAKVEAINGQFVVVNSQKLPLSRIHKTELITIINNNPDK